MKKIIIVLFACIYLCSCTMSTVYLKYIDNVAIPNIDETAKPDATFSIDWGFCWQGAQTCWMKDRWQQEFAEVIRNRLLRSGMFRSVRQTTFANKSDYHFDFEVNFDNPDIDSSVDFFTGSSVASGLLLLIPPMITEDIKVDFTMRLFADNWETYAIAVPADSSTTFSLLQIPFFLLTALANRMPTDTLNSAMDYFIGKVAENRLYDKTEQINIARSEKAEREAAVQQQQAAQPASSGASQNVDTGVKPYTPDEPAILDKEEYIKKAKEILAKGPVNGTIELPKLGVLFKIGSSELLPYYHEMLDSFIDLYKQTDGSIKINIDGYSSNGGNETAKNPDIANSRAASVANYMKRYGIKNYVYTSNLFLNIVDKDSKNSFYNKNVEKYVALNLEDERYVALGKSKGCKGGQCLRRADVSVSIHSLGHAYYEKKDYSRALQTYLKDYEQGKDVEFYIGVMYHNGEGTEKDYAEALRWYTISVEKSKNPGAYNQIGYMYLNGEGVKLDYVKAMSFFKKAWEAGEPNGAANIGNMYEKGLGVEKNLSIAKEWYKKAADKENEYAKKALERLSAE